MITNITANKRHSGEKNLKNKKLLGLRIYREPPRVSRKNWNISYNFSTTTTSSNQVSLHLQEEKTVEFYSIPHSFYKIHNQFSKNENPLIPNATRSL